MIQLSVNMLYRVEEQHLPYALITTSSPFQAHFRIGKYWLLGHDIKQTFAHNEIMAGLSRQSVIGTFARKNTLIERLAALAMHAFVYDKLNKKIPVFILNSEEGLKHYTRRDQFNDFKTALQLPKEHTARLYAEIYFELVNPELRKLVTQSIKRDQSRLKLDDDSSGIVAHFVSREELARLEFQRSREPAPSTTSLSASLATAIPKPKEISEAELSSLKARVAQNCNDTNHHTDNQQQLEYDIEYLCAHHSFLAMGLFLNAINKHENLSCTLTSFLKNGMLYKLTEKKFEEFFAKFFFTTNETNIEYLLRRNVKASAIKTKATRYKAIIRVGLNCEDYLGSHPGRTIELNLLASAIIWNPQICSVILKHKPDLVKPALQSMRTLYQDRNDYERHWNVDIVSSGGTRMKTCEELKPDAIQKAYIDLLTLTEKQGLQHDYSYEEKRLLENEFKRSIDDTTSESELMTLRDKLAQLPCMSARRHPTADSIRAFFFTPKATRLEREVKEAIELKRSSFGVG